MARNNPCTLNRAHSKHVHGVGDYAPQRFLLARTQVCPCGLPIEEVVAQNRRKASGLDVVNNECRTAARPLGHLTHSNRLKCA